MSDLVERLRALSMVTTLEAADEIERLRVALEQVVDVAKDGVTANSDWCREIAERALRER